ncbi:MAG: hypothetical protein E7265_01845 [Lachnospiraceae bacterium]|nr:hypothetical protein [Lachnospiraceae bacterium]MBE5945036.1 hypothetical protein [Lachnospiraceae bacterium]
MLEVKNLTIEDVEGQCLVEDISFHINKEDFVVLFGDDADARKELIHCIMGYKRYYSGEVCFGEEAGCVRYLPDDILYEESMTAADYFRMVSSRFENYNINKQEQLCEKLGIDKNEELLEMTFEDNKLVQFIAMVCSEPDVIIVDELHSYITAKTMKMLFKYLKKTNELGTTIIYSCTDYETVKSVCNRFIMLDEGKVVADRVVDGNDVRKRIITLPGGRSETLESIFGEYIATRNNRSSYVCNQPLDKVPVILYKIGSKDYLIEEMTLAEELTNDYSRWEEL